MMDILNNYHTIITLEERKFTESMGIKNVDYGVTTIKGEDLWLRADDTKDLNVNHMDKRNTTIDVEHDTTYDHHTTINNNQGNT